MAFYNDIDDLRPRARKISHDLGLRLEETEGSLAMLKKVIRQALDSGKESTGLDK